MYIITLIREAIENPGEVEAPYILKAWRRVILCSNVRKTFIIYCNGSFVISAIIVINVFSAHWLGLLIA